MADSVYISNLPSASDVNDTDYLILEQSNTTKKTTVSNFRNALSTDLDFVPTSRTVNGLALSDDIELTASDIGLGNVTNNAQLTIANNLSDIANTTTARSNLGVYSTSQVFTQDETYSKAQLNTMVTYASYYGVTADGTTDDTTAMTAAIAGAGTGLLVLPKGSILISGKLTIPTGLTLQGQGIDATIILAAAGMTGNMIETTNSTALVGGNTNAGASYWGLTGLTLDGNRTAGGAVYGIYTYSRAYKLLNIKITRCAYNGIYSEWYTGNDSSDVNTGAKLDNVTVNYCAQEGIKWNGPHHSQWANVNSSYNSQTASGSYVSVLINSAGNGLQVVNSSCFGSMHKYAWDVQAANVNMANVSAIGATTALFNILGDNFTWVAGLASGEVASASTLRGFLLGSSSVSIINPSIQGNVINCPLAAVRFLGVSNTYGGNIEISGYLDSTLVTGSSGYTGSVPTNWNVSVSIIGAANGPTIRQLGLAASVATGSASSASLYNGSDKTTGVYIYSSGVGVTISGVRSFFAGANYNIVAKTTSAPTSGLQEAMLYYDTTKKTISFYDGSNWRDILVS